MRSDHLFAFFFFKRSIEHQDLHSFPTRRSSDLVQADGQVLGIVVLLPIPGVAEFPDVRDDACDFRFRPARSLRDRKSTRLNSSHLVISYAVFCLKKKKKDKNTVRLPHID